MIESEHDIPIFFFKSEVSILKGYPKAFLRLTFILNHKKIKDTFCWTQALSFMFRLFRKRGADTFTERSQGLPSRKLVWWQYTDLSGRLEATLGIGDWLSPWLLTFLCVSGESYESRLAFPASLRLKEPLGCCIKWILQTVVFGIPKGEGQVRS